MSDDTIDRLLRQIDKLEDRDVLRLHREVCRRAGRIYEPLYREVGRERWRQGMMAAQPKIAAHNARVKAIFAQGREVQRGG